MAIKQNNLSEFTTETMNKAMYDGIMSLIKEKLRARILEAMEPDIKSSIDAACETFKVNVQSYLNNSMDCGVHPVVQMLIEHKNVVEHKIIK